MIWRKISWASASLKQPLSMIRSKSSPPSQSLEMNEIGVLHDEVDVSLILEGLV